MFFYSLIYQLVKLFFPKMHFETNNVVIEEPAIFVANHKNSFGPIASLLYFPIKVYPWIISNMVEKELFTDYIEKDFLKKELKIGRPLGRVISILIRPICLGLFQCLGAIPVYQNSRNIMKTINLSVELLESGKSIIIFPEDPDTCLNETINEFNTGFLEVAKRIYEKLNKKISIYPVAINKKKRTIFLEKPLQFNPHNNFKNEKKRIKRELEDAITRNSLNN